MKNRIRETDVSKLNKAAIIKAVKDAARLYTMDTISSMLTLCLTDIGYYPDTKQKSGFEFLNDVLNECFTDGLPVTSLPHPNYLSKLSDEQLYLWTINIEILQAVNLAILYSEGA